jgi:fluoride ion exporter CrcB/FEX
MKDLYHNLEVKTSLAPKTRTASENGTGVDLQGFEAALVVIHAGTITDGTHTPKLQESDDNSTWSDVGSSDLLGSFSNISSNSIQTVGYIGSKRYIRVVATVSGATSGGIYGATIVKGAPRHAPVV